MDHVQNKKVSMINERKCAISENNLNIAKKIKCIADAKFSPTCLDQRL